MKNNAIKVNDKDNVAVATQIILKGSPVVVDGQELLTAIEDIPLGHKVALLPFSKGDSVIRYSEPIVETTQEIQAGAWVHVHNTQPIMS